MINLAKDGIFSFSYTPITIIQIIGILSMFGAIGILCYVLISKFLGLVSPGWSSLMIVISFFSGAILFGMGVLGEYIRRIHLEVIKRPLFVSAKTYNLQGKALPPHVAMYISPKNKNLN